MGMARFKEALEANDWEGPDDLDDVMDPEDFDENDTRAGFGAEAAEMEMEMFGMKEAIHGGSGPQAENEGVDNDEEVEKLQALMLKMQAVRGMFPI